jgi:hypothetical protein
MVLKYQRARDFRLIVAELMMGDSGCQYYASSVAVC